jgi:hypothetical protein
VCIPRAAFEDWQVRRTVQLNACLPLQRPTTIDRSRRIDTAYEI